MDENLKFKFKRQQAFHEIVQALQNVVAHNSVKLYTPSNAVLEDAREMDIKRQDAVIGKHSGHHSDSTVSSDEDIEHHTGDNR